MFDSYERAFLRALAVTLACELCVIWVMVRCVLRVSPAATGSARLMAAVLLASGATLPYVWFLAPCAGRLDGARVVVVESLVALSEAGVYRLALPLSWSRCLALSFAANLASWALGSVLRG